MPLYDEKKNNKTKGCLPLNDSGTMRCLHIHSNFYDIYDLYEKVILRGQHCINIVNHIIIQKISNHILTLFSSDCFHSATDHKYTTHDSSLDNRWKQIFLPLGNVFDCNT